MVEADDLSFLSPQPASKRSANVTQRGAFINLSVALIRKNERAGQKPMPGLKDIPKLIWKQCLAYLLVLGGVAGAFVSGVVVGVLPGSLQPVSTTTVTPNSTIRVNNLFIVAVTFTKRLKRTSKIFPTINWGAGFGWRVFYSDAELPVRENQATSKFLQFFFPSCV